MTLREIPIGEEVTVMHQFLISETGGWAWEQEEITGTVYKHCNEAITIILSETRFVSCHNDKDEIIN